MIGFAAGFIMLAPVHIAKETHAKPPAVESPVDIITKRVYTELAQKMFDKADPSDILLVSKAIAEECFTTGVDPMFVIAMIEAESNFEIEAISDAGARGLMQIMPSTFREVSDSKRMFDPVENVKAGVRYINKLYRQGFTTPERLLHAYNQGPGAALAFRAGKIEMSEESKAYIPKVMNLYYKLQAQEGISKKDARKQFMIAMR